MSQNNQNNAKVKMNVISSRGMNTRFIFSITRMECGEIIELGTSSIKNLVLVRFKCALSIKNRCELQCFLSLKHADQAKNQIVGVKVFATDFEKHWICCDNWTEFVKVGHAIETNSNSANCMQRIVHPFLITIELNIRVYDITPKPLSVNKELFEDTTFTDFNLKADDGSVAVHKAVLGIHSDVFLAMLKREWTETSEGIFSIPGITMQTLLHFKDYMYLRTLPNDVLQLQQLLLIAACYMMDNLKTECIAKLVEMLTPENFEGIVEYACQNNMPDLMKVVVTDISDAIVHGIQSKRNEQVPNVPMT